MKLALLIGSQGNVRTETLRAFTEDEYRKIIAALPLAVTYQNFYRKSRTLPLNFLLNLGMHHELELPEISSIKPPKNWGQVYIVCIMALGD